MPKVHSEETKRKISEKMKGKTPVHLVNYWKGRKQTTEHRAKSIINLTHRYKKGYKSPLKGKKVVLKEGEKHWNYKHGLTKDKNYISWQKNLHNKRKRASEGSHTFGEWELLKKQYGFMCPGCRRIEPDIKLTEDHIIPLSKGGSDNIENIQPLCLKCNMKKSAKLIGKIQITNIN